MTVKPIAMRDALLSRVHRAMADDDSIFFVSADFGSPVLDRIRADHPKAFVNVGIAEQNLINVAAGLALEGHKVFAYAIAPFITMRCFEQVRVNLALMSEVRDLNVSLIGVGAGYSYVVSGPTHQCYEDLALMRALPNMRVYSPADHPTAAALIEPCLALPGPKYLRLDAQVLPVLHDAETGPDLAAGHVRLRASTDAAIIATGHMVHTALAVADRLAGEGLSIGVIDLFDLSGFDRAALLAAVGAGTPVVSLEEAFRARGGLDAVIYDLLASEARPRRFLNLGVEGGYRFELGTRAELHELVGIGVDAVTAAVRRFAADRAPR